MEHDIKPGTFYNWVNVSGKRQYGFSSINRAQLSCSESQEVVRVDSRDTDMFSCHQPSHTVPASVEPNILSVTESMPLSVGSFLLMIPNGTDPQLFGSDAPHDKGTGMLGDITAADEIYIVTVRTDMRKSIDQSCAIVEDQLHMDPKRSTLYLFCKNAVTRSKPCLENPIDLNCCINVWKSRAGSAYQKSVGNKTADLAAIDWLMSGLEINQPVESIQAC